MSKPASAITPHSGVDRERLRASLTRNHSTQFTRRLAAVGAAARAHTIVAATTLDAEQAPTGSRSRG